MRRATWLVLLGGLCIGCGKKDQPRPDVTIQPGGDPEVVVAPRDPAAGKVAKLDFAKLWEPKDAEKAEPDKIVKRFLAQRLFVKHQTECLAPAIVGTTAALGDGGLHGVVMPYALARAYPQLAKKMESEGVDSLVVKVTPNRPVLDYSTSGTGAASIRALALRVAGGTDDELRIHFGEYLTRLEEAVKATGVTLVVHQRGGLRTTGSLSDIRYESPGCTGFVRSVVVREYDEKNPELMTMIFGEVREKERGLFKSLMPAANGPYLVVAVREERR
jgi:hypothetical protein